MQEDKKIIEQILNGDKEKYRIIIEKYYKKIFAYIYKFLWNDTANAQDLTQTTFIKLYENLNYIDLNKPLQPFIYRIAHNETINFLKSIKRKKEIYTEEENWNILSEIIADTKKIDFDEENRKNLINKAINELDEKYKQVIILYFWEEKTYEEIAQILNKPINTVSTLISRAKKQLQSKLSKYIESDELLL